MFRDSSRSMGSMPLRSFPVVPPRAFGCRAVSTAPSGNEATCSGNPEITSEEPKLSQGCAHAACRRCRSRSKTSCVNELGLHRLGILHAGPKRETAPGEATSDVGSWWQSHEIDVDRRSPGGNSPGNSVGDGFPARESPSRHHFEVRQPKGQLDSPVHSKEWNGATRKGELEWSSDRSREGVSDRGKHPLFTERLWETILAKS